jgi:hypothetical protein
VRMESYSSGLCTVTGGVSADVKVQGGAMYSGWGVSVDAKVQGGVMYSGWGS